MMPTSYTDVDRLILDRWEDTKGLIEAYEDLQERMRDVIEGVGERLAVWGTENGYTIDTDAKRPEFYAYKPEWQNRRRDDAVVYFLLSGFAPFGYRNVKDDHPWLWLQTANLQMLKKGEPERQQFARDLRTRLGEQATAWSHEDADEADSPFGRYLTDVTDKDRLQLISDPDALYEFATKAFTEAFALSEAIDETLAKFRT
jgi:hypothetical protein